MKLFFKSLICLTILTAIYSCDKCDSDRIETGNYPLNNAEKTILAYEENDTLPVTHSQGKTFEFVVKSVETQWKTNEESTSGGECSDEYFTSYEEKKITLVSSNPTYEMFLTFGSSSGDLATIDAKTYRSSQVSIGLKYHSIVTFDTDGKFLEMGNSMYETKILERLELNGKTYENVFSADFANISVFNDPNAGDYGRPKKLFVADNKIIAMELDNGEYYFFES